MGVQMMTTPEGRVKAMVRDVLRAYGAYSFQPVQSGLGASGLDFHCVIRRGETAIAFFVETKKDELTDLTPRQQLLKSNLEMKQRAKVFVVGGRKSLKILSDWLETTYHLTFTGTFSSEVLNLNGRSITTGNPERIPVPDE
jgi:hypothetical protein